MILQNLFCLVKQTLSFYDALEKSLNDIAEVEDVFDERMLIISAYFLLIAVYERVCKVKKWNKVYLKLLNIIINHSYHSSYITSLLYIL